jgi:hypothetical protein
MCIYNYVSLYIYSIFVKRACGRHAGRFPTEANTSKTHKNTYKSPHLTRGNIKVAQTQKPTKTRVFRKPGLKNTQKYVCFGSERRRTQKYEKHKNTCVLLHGPLADSRNTQKHMLFYTWAKTCKNVCFLVFSIFGHPPAAPGSPSDPKATKETPEVSQRDPKATPEGCQRDPQRPKGGPRAHQGDPKGTPKDTKGPRRYPKAPRRVPKRTGNPRKLEKAR